MTPEQIAILAGAFLAILFEYLPGLSGWYDPLSPQQKRLFMLGLMSVVTAVAFGLSCAGLFAVFACTWLGAWDALLALVAAVAANQGVHLLTKRK